MDKKDQIDSSSKKEEKKEDKKEEKKEDEEPNDKFYGKSNWNIQIESYVLIA